MSVKRRLKSVGKSANNILVTSELINAAIIEIETLEAEIIALKKRTPKDTSHDDQ